MSDLDFHPVSVDQASMKANGYGVVNFSRSKYEGKAIRFYWFQIHNPAKSREAGIPIYDKEIHFECQTPGERLEVIDRPFKDTDPGEFPREWAAFQQNRVHVPDGTPVEILFPGNPDISATLRGCGFHTIQQLARATPHAIETVGMGMQDWVNKAQRTLAEAKEHKHEHLIEQEREQFKRELRSRDTQIADLIQRLGRLESGVAQHAPVYAANQMAQERAIDAQNARSALAPEPPPWTEAQPGFIAEEPEEPPKIDLRTKEGRAIKAAREGAVQFTKE